MCVCVCRLFCAEASFLYERPLTTPSLFFLFLFYIFPSLVSPWTLLYTHTHIHTLETPFSSSSTHQSPRSTSSFYFLCVFSLSLSFCFLSFFCFSPSSYYSCIYQLSSFLSHSTAVRTHTSATAGGTRAAPSHPDMARPTDRFFSLGRVVSPLLVTHFSPSHFPSLSLSPSLSLLVYASLSLPALSIVFQPSNERFLRLQINSKFVHSIISMITELEE